MRRTSKFEGGDGTDARKPAASAGPPQGGFVPLGVPVQAVVLRLRGQFPRVKVVRGADCEEEEPRPSADQTGEEPS